MERVAIDILGPLPKSADGNKYLLIAMDYFTKWPEGYPIPNMEAVTEANVLMEGFFSRSGMPLELHSDQGRNFESNLFGEVCEILGIHKTRTTPLHPQSDGMVERFNRTIEAQLSAFVEAKQKDWDKHVNDVVYRVQRSRRSKSKVVHRNRLWQYQGRESADWFNAGEETMESCSTLPSPGQQQPTQEVPPKALLFIIIII